MNIRRAASLSGLTPDTIRFYEREGILPAPPRRTNGYRDYSEQHTETLRLASSLRDLRIPLSEMRLALAVAHDGTCGDVRTALRETLEQALTGVEQRIEDLSAARGQMQGILRGLQSLPAGQREIPGVTPCECLRLVESI